MVAPEKRISKYIVSFVTNLQSNPQESSTALPMDIEIDTPRGWSVCTSSNSSIESLAHSDALSMAYAD